MLYKRVFLIYIWDNYSNNIIIGFYYSNNINDKAQEMLF